MTFETRPIFHPTRGPCISACLCLLCPSPSSPFPAGRPAVLRPGGRTWRKPCKLEPTLYQVALTVNHPACLEMRPRGWS